MRARIFALMAAATLFACDGDHGHDHGEHGHGHGDEHAHGDEQGHGDEHGHDDHGDTESWTAYGETTQIYAEFEHFEVGKPSEVLVHLTRLDDWRPVREGTVTIVMSAKGKDVKFGPVEPARPGIFELKAAPPPSAEGEVTVKVILSGPVSDEHVRQEKLGEDHEHADEGAHSHDEPVKFLLEQQWAIDFGLAAVETRRIRDSFEAYGTLRARLGGEGVVHAPVGGRVVGEDLPMLGSRVEKGQELAYLLPALADQGDLASLDLARSQAEVQLRAAESQRKRLEGLVRDGVVPERRLIDARFAEQQARAALGAAKRRMRQARGSTGSQSGKSRSSMNLEAPLSGVVVSVDVPPGLYVEAGRPLFRIVDPDPLWLEVQVPEVHVPRLEGVSGVWFEVDGFEEPFEVTDTQVSIGGVVDPHSRTLPLIVSVPNPDGALRPGMFANAHVIQGEVTDRIAVPAKAIVLEDGIPVAYVAEDGETFERRALRLGVRDGEFVEVRSGLKQGEWVVTDGAFAVRLAALGEQTGGHGHAH